MGEVAHELRGMRQAQEEAMEAQRRTFQVELEKITEELERVKLRSTALEKWMEISKVQKSTQKYNYAQKNQGHDQCTRSSRSDHRYGCMPPQSF